MFKLIRSLFRRTQRAERQVGEGRLATAAAPRTASLALAVPLAVTPNETVSGQPPKPIGWEQMPSDLKIALAASIVEALDLSEIPNEGKARASTPDKQAPKPPAAEPSSAGSLAQVDELAASEVAIGGEQVRQDTKGRGKEPVTKLDQPPLVSEESPSPANEVSAPDGATGAGQALQHPVALAMASVPKLEPSPSVQESVSPPPPVAVIDAIPASVPLEPLKLTSEHVIAAYKLFLGRQPESSKVIADRVGQSAERLLEGALTSSEFLNREANAHLVLAVAKQILLEQAEAEDQTKETV